MKTILKRAIRDEKGQTLIITLILLTLGGLIITPLLGLMATGLITGEVYEDKMNELYAADAGIEDGLWLIKNEELGSDLFGPDDPDYDPYAYYEYSSLYEWDYNLPSQINGEDVTVTIQNEWIPKDIPAPDPDTARWIALGTEGEPPDLIITGCVSNTEDKMYEIKISYVQGCAALITTIGIWLPPGFEYAGDCSLEGEEYYSEPVITPHKGGCAVVWNFVPLVALADFPDSFTFQYSGPQEQIPGPAVCWIEIDAYPYYTWDADVIVYKISSTATDPDTGTQTTIDSYTANIELRKLGSALSGDYHAIGNTLMTPTSHSYYRDRLFRESSATIDPGDIPFTSSIDAAWLYWSGWIEEAGGGLTIFYENCDDFDAPTMDWTAGNAWDIYSTFNNSEFRGNGYYEEPTGEWQLIWGTETCENFVEPVMNWTAESAWDIYNNSEFRGNNYDSGEPTGEWQVIWGTETCENFVAPVMDWAAESAWDIYNNSEFRGNNYYEEPTGEWQVVWGPETCENFDYPIMDWDAGSAWDTYYGEFRGNAYNLGDPSGEWQLIWSDDCSDFGNWVQTGSDWSTPSGWFRGHHDGSEDDRYLTMAISLDLSDYTGQTVEVSWQQDEDNADSDDCLRFQLSNDGGANWGALNTAFCNDNPPSSYTYTIPDQYLTNNFRMRFYLDGFDYSGLFGWGTEYCYIDNIEISVLVEPPSDPRYLTMSSSIDLSDYAGQTVEVSWQQDDGGELESDDCLYFNFYNGSTWSTDYLAFCNDDPTSSFTYTIPDQYLTNNFRIRFYLSGFTGSSEYCFIDNIEISRFVEPQSQPTGSYLTMLDSIPLSAYAGQTVRISWRQHESGDLEYGDCLYFDFYNGSTWITQPNPAFCNDIGSTPQAYTYTIPASYLTDSFKMRFYLDGFNDTDWWGNPNEYCYIDNIEISVFDASSTPGSHLTMLDSIPLLPYAGQTVRISWQQSEDGYLEYDDCLYFNLYNGSTWSTDYLAFCDDSPSSSFTYTIPDQYLTNSFRMRFYLSGFTSSSEYCFIDNIEISVYAAPPSEPPERYLTMSTSIPLGAYAGQTVEVSWQQDEDGYLEDDDRLYFAFYDGSTWSDDIEAFRNDNPESPFTYTIPDQYLTNSFRMRFYLSGFTSSSEYCYIDDIMITTDLPVVETAKVNRVMFNDTEITTDQWQIAYTPDSGAQDSWSYSCYYDATDIVRAELDPDTKSGTFTLGHVLEGSGYSLYPSGTTGYPLATPAACTSSGCSRYQWSYAGWSLLIIYSSPETKGHQLYLFDTFRYVGLDTLVEFSISNFLAPEDTTGSHLTYFVGEGDNHYTTDYIKVNGYKLPQPGDPYEPYSGFNPQNNVFNSYSNSLDDPYLSGVDIDTFDVSVCIEPNDISAQVILDNGQEIYNLVYIILSFRSLITSGGVMGYLIIE